MLEAHDLTKTYRRNADSVEVLRGLDLTVERGEFLSIVGASGSGKSTLLHLLGTLDAPDSGRIILEGQRIDNLRGKARDRLRNQTFGFIFQFYHLLPELSALDNVLMPAYITESVRSWWTTRREWKRRATELLETVGLSHRIHHKPREMSGGEMQRTAIARALLTRPRLLLADEPTGNLDVETGGDIVRTLKELNDYNGVTIVLVTHNLEITHVADRVVKMVQGQVVTEPSKIMAMPHYLAAV